MNFIVHEIIALKSNETCIFTVQYTLEEKVLKRSIKISTCFLKGNTSSSNKLRVLI